jgi:type I restriction enzyme R subunit
MSSRIKPTHRPQQIDFDALKAQFASGYKHTETEKLKGIISSQLTQMLRLNKSRMNYLDKFQQMIDEYNAGSAMWRYFLPIWSNLPENSI